MRSRGLAALGVACLASALLSGCSVAVQPASAPTAAPGDAASAPAASPSAASGGAAGTITACGLVTQQEVGDLLGADPGVGIETTSQGGATQCSYGASPSFALVTMLPTEGKAAYESAQAHVLASDAAPMMSDVPGVGDGALVVDSGIYSTIEFYKGEVFVSIVVGSSAASTVDIATNLAHDAVARL